MKLKRFDVDNQSHIDEVNSWLRARDSRFVMYKSDFPKLGFLIHGVGCGFLRVDIEGTLGMVENFATNPAASSKERDKAIDLIMKECMKLAKSYDLKTVLFITNYESILARAIKDFGFQEVKTKIAAKNL